MLASTTEVGRTTVDVVAGGAVGGATVVETDAVVGVETTVVLVATVVVVAPMTRKSAPLYLLDPHTTRV